MESLAFVLAAGIWSQWLWPILLLVIGLGFVIFVHELGHFLAAKAVGIKVERFAIGFGPRLVGFRKGETDYCIKLLPLGGYVKMLGQEDVRPLEENQSDPRAFNNKSVGARFFVISAGVVMNVIFAAIFFIIVCMIGMRFQAPVIGGTIKGMPAAMAKIQWRMPDDPSAVAPEDTIQSGDEILEINGKPVDRFSQPNLEALLADPDDKFTFKIKRIVDGREWTGTTIIPVAFVSDGKRLGFGIVPARDTVFDGMEDVIASDDFEEGDRVVKIDGKDVEHYWDIDKIEKTLTGKPVVVTVDRGQDRKPVDITVQPTLMGGNTGKVFWDRKDETRRYGAVISQDDKFAELQLEDGSTEKVELYNLSNDELLDILGMIPRIQIVGISEGSPADNAGLKPGDIIVDYAERGAPTLRQMHDINAEFADKGTYISVLRDDKTLPAAWIVPKTRENGAQVGIMQRIDLTHTVLAGVRPDSAAAKAGLMMGDVIEKINNTPVTTWIDVFNALKQLQDEKATITYNRGGEQKTADIDKLDKSVFDVDKYSYVLFAGPRDFKLLMGPEVKKGPLAALPWGLGETWEFILSTYASFRSLIIGTVSVEELRGPVGIGSIAIKVGRKSLVEFIYLMAMISASLAVVNFLPIPVVDGGHAMFLIIEKVRGKPVPVKIMNIVQLIGLGLLLFAFVAITWNDIARIIKELW